MAAAFVLLLAPARAPAAVWRVLGGPDGADVRVVASDPTTPGRVYAGTAQSGVFRSDDGGGRWSGSRTGLPSVGVRDLSVAGVAGRVFVATDGGLARSDDAGATWRYQAHRPDVQEPVEHVVVDPHAADVVLAVSLAFGGTPPRMWRSGDGGEHWSEVVLDGDRHVSRVVFDPIVDVAYAATVGAGEILASTDGGATWSTVGVAGGASALTVVPTTPRTFYAAGGQLRRSTDGGSTWPALTLANVTRVVVDPETPTTVYALTPSGVFVSPDAGDHFTPLPLDVSEDGGPAFAVDATTPSTLYAGLEDGVFRSTDAGGTWHFASAGLTGTAITALAVAREDPARIYAGTYMSGVFASEDGGITWRGPGPLPKGYVYDISIQPGAPLIAYAAGDAGILKTTDGGEHWTNVLRPTGNPAWLKQVVIDPLTPTTLYAPNANGDLGDADPGLFKSTDAGASWLPAGLADVAVEAIAVDATRGTLHAFARDGRAYASDDAAATWRALGQAVLSVPPLRVDLLLDPTRPRTLLASPDQLFTSPDSGRTWHHTFVGPPFPLGPIRRVLADPASEALVVSDYQGIHARLAGEACWQAVDDGRSDLRSGSAALALAPGAPSTLYAAPEGVVLSAPLDLVGGGLPAACAGHRVPRAILRRVRRACTIVAHASRARTATRRERMLRRAGKPLDRLSRAVQSLPDDGTLPAECVTALRRVAALARP